MKYIIGNWKANKNIAETIHWLDAFLKYDFAPFAGKAEIIICPPYPLIPIVKDKTSRVSCLKVGSQDLSMYPAGVYTGEVTARTLAGLVDYAIVGHSERRKYFQETNVSVENKIIQAHENGIKTILCISKISQLIDEADIIAYEQPDAISSGDGKGANIDIKQVIEFKKDLHLAGNKPFIYGGSVNEENAGMYLKNEEIDGVLPGGTSLDPERFYKIVASL